jgi:protein-tyrosine kinase
MTDLAQIYPTDAPTNDIKTSALATRIGRLLLQTGKIDNAQLNAIINLQSRESLRFGDAAIKLGVATPEDIRAALDAQFSYPNVRSRDSKLSPELIAAFQPDSKQAEALRSLRSELYLRYFNGGSHLSLAMIGAEDATGIALTSANLAICFSQLGIRTLLIDANLREPQLHKWFGIDSRQPGLADVLAGRARAQPLAIPELRFLCLMPAGTIAPNPQELLANRNYVEQMNSLYQDYEVILINTAPLDTTRDAQLVAAQAGAALLITREHQTRMKNLVAVCNGLKGLGVRLLGTVLRQ